MRLLYKVGIPLVICCFLVVIVGVCAQIVTLISQDKGTYLATPIDIEKKRSFQSSITSQIKSFDHDDAHVKELYALAVRSNYPKRSTLSISHNLREVPPLVVADSPEVHVVHYLYSLLQKSGSVKDARFQQTPDRQKLLSIIADDEASTETQTIPSDLHPIYTGESAIREIKDVLLSCRDEYVDYLKTHNTHTEYIQELDRIFPPDLSTFEYSDSPVPDRQSIAYVQDIEGGKKRFVISAVHIYFGSVLYKRSGIFEHLRTSEAGMYEKVVRDFSIRKTCYHEFTHILQEGVKNVNKGANKYAYYDQGETLESSTPTLSGYFDTSDLQQAIQLEDAIAEAQAEGLSYQMLLDIYDLSPTQRTALWDQEFGRLKLNRERINEVAMSLHRDFSDGDLLDLASRLGALCYDIDDPKLSFYTKKHLDRLVSNDYVAWIGYLNPTTVRDNDVMFDYLTSTHKAE